MKFSYLVTAILLNFAPALGSDNAELLPSHAVSYSKGWLPTCGSEFVFSLDNSKFSKLSLNKEASKATSNPEMVFDLTDLKGNLLARGIRRWTLANDLRIDIVDPSARRLGTVELYVTLLPAKYKPLEWGRLKLTQADGNSLQTDFNLQNRVTRFTGSSNARLQIARRTEFRIETGNSLDIRVIPFLAAFHDIDIFSTRCSF